MANKKQIISYIDAMIKASEIIKRENPDYLIAPLMGSVPFVEVMNIVSNDFDNSRVFYLPSSSRIHNVNEIIRSWYFNFLKDKTTFPDFFPKIMGIDEVVSGHSVIRGFKEIDIATNKFKKEIRQDLIEKLYSKKRSESLKSLRKMDIASDNKYSFKFSEIRNKIKKSAYINDKKSAKEDSDFFVGVLKETLENKLNYSTIGIEDSKKEGNRDLKYEELKKQKRVFQVKVDNILTMDNIHYCTPRFKEIRSRKNNYVRFLPQIKDILITEEYLDFLTTLAKYSGKRLSEVFPVNIKRVFDSSKYLDKISKE